MKIYCQQCQLYLGDIRDATLRKNIAHICSACASTIRLQQRSRQSNDDILPPEFRELFGMNRGRY